MQEVLSLAWYTFTGFCFFTIGSFLGICIDCIPQKKPFPRLFDRIYRRGETFTYPVVELLTSVLLMLLVLRHGITVEFFLYAVAVCILIACSFIDYKHMLIPDELVLTLLSFTVVYKLFRFELSGFLSSIAGFLLAGSLFFLIAFVTKGAMGGGDIKLMAALGFLLTARLILLQIFLSFWFAAVVSVLLIATKRRTRRDYIPFGPFIAAAAYATMLFGEEFLTMYLNFLGL